MNLGHLYIVATPIGNLEDISLRSLRTLKEVDYVLCEDTRLTKRILDKYEISTATISYHQHSKLSKIQQILKYLKEGKNLALVSDAGTPGISDPGSALIAAAFKEYGDELKVSPIPGPSAVIAALSVSGWPVDRFSFFGFLPHKKGRQTMIKEILASPYPVAFYESKHRLAKCLAELDFFSKDQGLKIEIMIAREVTKMFESFYFGSPSDLLTKLDQDTEMQKGEFVVCLRKVK
jgi:16S rRNA (cytidine1402-2'-O)-methyltransferase